MSSHIPLHTNGHALLPKRTNAVHVFAEPGEDPLVVGAHFTCAICDERPVYVLRDGAVHVREPCRYPRGITTEVTLDVPTGKLIVTADLRDVYDADIHAGATALGQAQAVEAMANLGCAYGPVGNSCPSLYRNGEDGYIIASPIPDDDDLPSLPDENRMADICTDDLWAYSIADFED
ncbi:hypothetical protein ACIP5N_22135 [Streptomyces sp. NPDC088768]|uniref:hypothetical protein n=1 Tax=Streptomyces sp. NPDC088768 TaxID=3365894 RepID=UPI0037F41861